MQDQARFRGMSIVLLLCTMLPALASADEGSVYREEMDDPPGIPALPVPDAPPSDPVRFGPFSSVQVNVAAGGANIPGDAANEPSITVNPTRPNSIAIGWRQFDTIASNFRQAGNAFSTDGGRTWTNPGVLTPGTFRSDPVLSYDAQGTFYYSSLKGDFSVDIFRSTDSGDTWGTPVPAFGGDKQWIAVDRTDNEGQGHIYQSWSGNFNIFTRSVDGGASYEAPTNIPDEPRWGTLDVGPNGTLYVSGISNSTSSIFYVARSLDAQDSEVSPTFITTTVDMGGTVVVFDGGSPNPGGLMGQVWVATDHSSGPTAGNVYALCSVDPPGADPMDIHFIRSTDGGATWSAPVRVNDDDGNDWQWFGTMSVAPNGRIDVVWNDGRNTALENQSELHYSFSTDGGVTWSANQQLSPAWDSLIGWPNQSKIGDYYDMISDRVGAHLAWAATFNGEQDVYYLRINDYDCNGNGIPDTDDIAFGAADDNGNGIPDECEGMTTAVAGAAPGERAMRLRQNAPNPFNPSTTIRFDVPTGGAEVRLEIVDTAGRHVRTLIDARVDVGERRVVWDGKNDAGEPMASGVYLYRLQAGDQVETRKLVLAR